MKKLYTALSAVTLISLSAYAVPVDGYCFLENQANHQGTKVLFQADSPSAVTDSTYTDSAGYYQIDIALGVYDVFFTHEGFLDAEILDQLFYLPITLPDVTLTAIPDGIIISGSLSGIFEDTTYIVVGDIYVNINDSLTIEPGSIFYFLGAFSFTINGGLYAEGTVSDSIRFIPLFGVPAWNGIDFSGADSGILDYCFITSSVSSGISCINSSPTISHCKFSGNSASNGGGICCSSNSNPTISHCAISGNSTNNGGGIYCSSNSNPTISFCTISGNSASTFGGGGIYWENCSPTVFNCVISGNSAISGSGGGIDCSFTSSTIANCIISGNSTNSGGGISVGSGSSPTISHCAISGNTAVDGGGISCYGNLTSSPTIENCTISGNSAAWTGAGIYCNSFSSTIVNTIVEGNTGNGGIYFTNCQNPSVTNSDFYNNGSGSFTGSPPQWLGMVVMVNVNGDSCDLYYNIFEDPLFVDPVGGDFHLQPFSHCIDAGDPTSPLDPDSTIADIGAFYYDQGFIPLLNVTLTPHNPPIQIPAGGGSFLFDILIENNGAAGVVFDGWTVAILPDSSIFGPIILRTGLFLAAGGSILREDMTQFVPPAAPSGDYIYTANVGLYPDNIIDSDSFPFEKLPGYDASNHNHGWALYGWDGEEASTFGKPTEFILHPVHPNPFNSITNLRFELPEVAKVKLNVYNMLGQEVVTLIDNDNMNPGYHQTYWNGADRTGKAVASGLYFYRFEAVGQETGTKYANIGKMILLK